MRPIALAVQKVLADPTASYWLKDALAAAMARDPVDAANDAEVLARILAECAGQVRGGACVECGHLEADHGLDTHNFHQ